MVWFVVFNATFSNISFISWQLVLLVEEIARLISAVIKKCNQLSVRMVNVLDSRIVDRGFDSRTGQTEDY